MKKNQTKGTSLQGKITVTRQELVDTFGEGDNGLWTLITPDGVATIYQHSDIGDRYSVGGHTPGVVYWVLEALKKPLANIDGLSGREEIGAIAVINSEKEEKELKARLAEWTKDKQELEKQREIFEKFIENQVSYIDRKIFEAHIKIKSFNRRKNDSEPF